MTTPEALPVTISVQFDGQMTSDISNHLSEDRKKLNKCLGIRIFKKISIGNEIPNVIGNTEISEHLCQLRTN